MASGKLKKFGTKEGLYRVTKHNYRLSKNYSNKDIDLSRSHLNRHYGPQTAEEFREKFRAMIKAADEKHPPKRMKKDRQTMLEVVVWSPREGMSPEQEAAWSEAAYKALDELFPGQLVGGTYHADEVHEYELKNGEKHISRGNTHIDMIPWTGEKGLNMDAFYKRSLPNRINEKLDEVCMEMFGIPYRDGTGKKSNKTVEELKYESKIAALENKVDGLQNEVLDWQGIANDKRQEAEGVAEEVYKPYIAAVERLMEQYKALKPKQQAKERTVLDILEKSGKVFGQKNPKEISAATAALKRESDRIEADYLSVVSDDEGLEL